MGWPDHAQAAEMALTRTMLAGRGLTCMKRWALGEEFSTIRFTMLMKVSLSPICSGGRNGRPTQPRLWLSPHTPLWFSAGNGRGSCFGGLRHPVLSLHTFHPMNCFCTSADALMQMSRQCQEATGPSLIAWKRPCKAQGLCPGVPSHTDPPTPFPFLTLLWMKTHGGKTSLLKLTLN